MTRDDVVKLLRIISASYPNWKPANMSDTADAWQLMLNDYDYGSVAVALKAYITTDNSGFAPSIGQIVNLLHTMTDTELNESEAWNMVYKAICNSGYNSESEFANLPEIVQKAVGSAGNLRSMSIQDGFNISVESSNFKRIYRTTCEREKQLRMMPEDVKRLVNKKQTELLEGDK